jgi:hypothetical protein
MAMKLRTLLVSLFVATVAVACSVKTTSKKPATGTPKTSTTKPPASAQKPSGSTKTSPTVKGSTGSSAPVPGSNGDDQLACSAEEEGIAVCVDTYVVFCAAQKVWALDCASAFGATCGDVDGTIDCVLAVEE